jgi:hypothetical protein
MIISKASLLSLRTHTILERKPWRVAFWAERALPSGVVGPWDSAPLARLAAIFFSDVIFILVLDGPGAGPGNTPPAAIIGTPFPNDFA